MTCTRSILAAGRARPRRSLALLLAPALLASAWAPRAWAQSAAQEEQRRQEISPQVGSQQVTQELLRGRLDLNRATLEELLQLPIPAEVAQNIWSYRTYERWFRSIYDLNDVEGMTPQLLAMLWDKVATLPPDPQDEALQRYEAGFRQALQFLNQEGAREELAEEYLDQLRDPQDVNSLDLYQLQTFQNVSPVDAVAVLRAREMAGRIEGERQLRSSDGLSYWGFRNLRDFVTYTPRGRSDELHGDAQMILFNRQYSPDDVEVLREPLPGETPEDIENSTAFGVRGLESPNPGLLMKLRLRLGHDFKGGIMSFRNVGEERFDETLKGYVAWHPTMTGSARLQNLVVGNFRVAFGQGLVMDNTDYFLPRKTGSGFNTRPMTLLGDLSRSYEFALRGVAAEGSLGPLHGTAFFSSADKDGVLNPDGSINKYIIMTPRLTSDELAAMSTNAGSPFLLKRDAFHESMIGGNLKFELTNGTYVGLSGYEARTDRAFSPRDSTLIQYDDFDLLEARDSEFRSDYDSRNLGKFRRVLGAEFQTVYKNAALQGEYAKLDSSPDEGLAGILSAAPDAAVLNGWVQFSDLTLQAIFRSYDVGFDNPYARAFSNDSRYEQTLLGDPFRLQNPLLSWLDLNTPQMKPERGVFLSARYRVSRQLTLTGLEYDQWTRVADGQDQQRWTVRAEYSPIFPLRFRLRQRFSSRAEDVLTDVRRFSSWETRLDLQVRLSDYDQLQFLYSAGNTEFAGRPRLSAAAQSGAANPLSEVGSPGQALLAAIIHNVNDRLTLGLSSAIYDGFYYIFEDNEFVVTDAKAMRNWAVLSSRLSDTLQLRFKLTNERQLTRNNVDIRSTAPSSFNSPSGAPIDGPNARARDTWFRLQLDYTF